MEKKKLIFIGFLLLVLFSVSLISAQLSQKAQVLQQEKTKICFPSSYVYNVHAILRNDIKNFSLGCAQEISVKKEGGYSFFNKGKLVARISGKDILV